MRLREHLGEVRGEPDDRVLDCTEVKALLAPVWKQKSYCPERGRDNPASFHAVTQIDLCLLDHFLMALAWGKNLHSNKGRLGPSYLIVPIICRFAGIDADIGSVIRSTNGKRQFAVDRELLLLEEFSDKICLDPSMVTAGYRFASFLLISERARLNFDCHGPKPNRKHGDDNANLSTQFLG